jgi:DNA-binding response OmpR family regulator
LNSRGFCALEVQSASDAYRWASEVAVSVIVTDAELQGDEDGFCLARKLKGDTRLGHVPVIIVAHRTAEGVREAARQAECHLASTTASARSVSRLISRFASRPETSRVG